MDIVQPGARLASYKNVTSLARSTRQQQNAMDANAFILMTIIYEHDATPQIQRSTTIILYSAELAEVGTTEA